jgi:hypothetical protein
MWLLTHLALDTQQTLSTQLLAWFYSALGSRRFPYLTHLLR